VLIVAFQGERGAFSEAAAVEYFGAAIQPLPCATFEAVFEAVERDVAQRGMIPVENSQQRIEHNLIVLPGVTLSQVRRVYSHPQALAQCEGRLKQLLPEAELVPTYDTAGSVKMLRDENIRDGAAIASRRAAEIYGMDILQPGMEDSQENYTRFLVLAREAVVPEGPAKTSIVFSVNNVPGALFKCLAVFALRDIDLTKIESRPLRDKRWEYLFYVDFAGSIYEARCRNALNHLQEITSFFRVLGSYPRGV